MPTLETAKQSKRESFETMIMCVQASEESVNCESVQYMPSKMVIQICPRRKYEVDLEKITNLEDFVDWGVHLMGKDWVDTLMLYAFISEFICACRDSLNPEQTEDMRSGKTIKWPTPKEAAARRKSQRAELN